MNDGNLGIEQPSGPCTNQNSIHSPQRNGDVLSDRKESVGGSSISLVFLFSACGNGGSTKFKKCNYSCTNYKKSCVTCNSPNIIYLITCSNCFMQYVGETAQQLNIRFATHRVGN